MPKLDLTRARRIKTAAGEVTRLKGAGFAWEGVARPWTPADLPSAKAWWHYADASTSGGEVVAWTDRIAGVELEPHPTTALPTLAPLGSRTVPYFNGAVLRNTDHALAQSIFRAQRYGWIFAVYMRDGIWSTYAEVASAFAPFRTTGSVTNLRLTLMDNQASIAGRPSMGSRGRDLDSFAYLGPGGNVVEGEFMALSTIDWQTAEGAMLVNGVETVRGPMIGWAASNGGVSPDTAGYGVGLGGDIDTGLDGLRGVIGAVVMGNGELPSPAQVEKLHGWAAHEFSLQHRLPIDHPFRSSPPVIGRVPPPDPGAGNPEFVQAASAGHFGGVNPTAVTIASVAEGSTLVLVITGTNDLETGVGQVVPSELTNPAGAVWGDPVLQRAQRSFGTDVTGVAFYVAHNVAAGSHTITATWPTAGYLGMTLIEVSGASQVAASGAAGADDAPALPTNVSSRTVGNVPAGAALAIAAVGHGYDWWGTPIAGDGAYTTRFAGQGNWSAGLVQTRAFAALGDEPAVWTAQRAGGGANGANQGWASGVIVLQ